MMSSYLLLSFFLLIGSKHCNTEEISKQAAESAGAGRIMFTVVGHGLGDPSSNLIRGCLHHM